MCRLITTEVPCTKIPPYWKVVSKGLLHSIYTSMPVMFGLFQMATTAQCFNGSEFNV